MKTTMKLSFLPGFLKGDSDQSHNISGPFHHFGKFFVFYCFGRILFGSVTYSSPYMSLRHWKSPASCSPGICGDEIHYLRNSVVALVVVGSGFSRWLDRLCWLNGWSEPVAPGSCQAENSCLHNICFYGTFLACTLFLIKVILLCAFDSDHTSYIQAVLFNLLDTTKGLRMAVLSRTVSSCR